VEFLDWAIAGTRVAWLVVGYGITICDMTLYTGGLGAGRGRVVASGCDIPNVPPSSGNDARPIGLLTGDARTIAYLSWRADVAGKDQR
jgi:hypothetical protein